MMSLHSAMFQKTLYENKKRSSKVCHTKNKLLIYQLTFLQVHESNKIYNKIILFFIFVIMTIKVSTIYFDYKVY